MRMSIKIGSIIMNFDKQDRHCHPERSEGSPWPGTEILSEAKDDITDLIGMRSLLGFKNTQHAVNIRKVG